ncbi:LicD family protein [Bacillus cereus]|uniref:YxeA family protein n=1 Tax=Bacillus cereus TaxID=1396 RepID=UPI000BFA47D7|nr:YxeA family protein [Bacillus cereus]PFK37065.1 LicD family protein [Bacillus cereus]PFR20433.1 LicD family protein [Bacillus cereus]PFR51887.1 LicD family protein [Bacillus cereus]
MKWIMRILVLLAIVGGAFYYMKSGNGYYSTKQYYVKVTTDATVENDKLSNGEVLTYHAYDEKVYDKKGKERDLKISVQNELEKNQYYLIDWEDRRGIVSKIAKVDQTKIDKSILNKLNGNS